MHPVTPTRDILLVAVGSHGDVHPFVGIGMGLRARGHRVRVIVNPHFESVVRGAGLEIVPLGTDAEYRALATHPDLWHRTRGPRYIFQQMSALVPRVYQAIVEHHVPGQTVVVHSTLAMGARVAQEKLGIATATVHLQPAIIRSAILPPTLPGAVLPMWLPLMGRRFLLFLADKLILDPMLAPALNEFRASLGLSIPARSIVHTWWNSPQRVIGLFPEWYAPPQEDWLPQIRLTGFPLYDERGVFAMPPELNEFLQSGTPPIAFTPGSAMWKADEFFKQGAEACRILGRRGLLLAPCRSHSARFAGRGDPCAVCAVQRASAPMRRSRASRRNRNHRAGHGERHPATDHALHARSAGQRRSSDETWRRAVTAATSVCCEARGAGVV